MKIKVSQAQGLALDWMVGKCEGEEMIMYKGQLEALWTENGWKPSSDWAQAGPIIGRECIEVSCLCATGYTPDTWTARHPQRYLAKGPTPLIAAMRCFVSSRMGDEVEVPDEVQSV